MANTTPPQSQYIHGADPQEQTRLSQLNEMLNEQSLAELRLRGDERILDVGSGLGQLAAAMADLAPRGRVLGVERNESQLKTARAQHRSHLEFRQGDALALPLKADEWGSFDIAHTRFLLEHVPDPLAVVRQMVQAVRPGGRIVLEDDDHDILRLWPEPAGFSALWTAYVRTYDRLGNDPFVGRRLLSLLHVAGARPERNTLLFWGAAGGTPRFDTLVTNLIHILLQSRELAIQAGLLDQTTFDEAIAALRVWAQRPDAAFWYAVSWAEGIRRA
jgi:SAM-dependent methyltransferase